MNHKLPELSYSYDALEPYIDTKTMEIHHQKHHGGYVSKLNAALEAYPQFQNKSVEELLANLSVLPEAIRTAVQNNGGGHFNHSLFWSILKKNQDSGPKNDISDAINRFFGSYEQFKDEFFKTAMGRFGSGWAWLVINDDDGLSVLSTPNQDTPFSQGKRILLGLDVWEHAYYLNYQNRRNDYVDAWWNVLDWQAVAERYDQLK
jgi:Fe-Mn family superoxide dismutase